MSMCTCANEHAHNGALTPMHMRKWAVSACMMLVAELAPHAAHTPARTC